MRKKLLLVFIVWILILTVLYLPRKRFSHFENRYLSSFTFPTVDTLISLEWMDEFETALCEQFNFRNASITLKTYMDRLLGQTDNGRVYFAKEDYLMELEEEPIYLEKNIEALNELASYTSTPIDFMPVYHALCTLVDLRPDFTSSHQQDIMSTFKDKLQNIHIIDLYDAFFNQKEYYYKTDHHWTLLGAKKAYEVYTNEVCLEELVIVKDDFLGTLYNQAPTLNSVTDSILQGQNHEITATYSDGTVSHSYYFENHLNTSDAYRYYLNGNYERIDIKTSSNNGKSILIIKDSYANSMIPFLNDDYQYMTVIDLRYGNTNLKNVLDEGFDRCLVLYEMDQFASDKDFSRGVSYD